MSDTTRSHVVTCLAYWITGEISTALGQINISLMVLKYIIKQIKADPATQWWINIGFELVYGK